MSDSNSSDYNVEDYIIPDTIKRTYNNDDFLSDENGSDDDCSQSSATSSGDVAEEDRQNNPDSQCAFSKVSNITRVSSSINAREKQDIQKEEPVRTNKRFILYVTNLSSTTTKTMLEDFFGDSGAIRSIRIPKVRLGSFAFVEMKDFDGFKAGLKCNNKELDGRKIQVYEGSKNKKHTSTKARNLKRKAQQQHLSNIKLKNKKVNKQEN